MDKKSKSNSGLYNRDISGKLVLNRFYSEEEKHIIIQDYLTSNNTKQAIWEKYTGQKEEHGQILRWMRNLGYDSFITDRIIKFGRNNTIMAKKEKASIEEFETLRLNKKIAELEKQLEEAKMKSIAYSTMIDIAEKELDIPIRKKSNTKPSKK